MPEHPPANAAVIVSRSDAVAVLTMNRPEKRNSLSDEMIAALQSSLEDAAADAGIHAVVIRAEGPAFCAGHDLKEMTARRNDTDAGHAAYVDLFDRCANLMTTIVRHPKPVIAEIQGPAVAAGCQLVASCDLAVANDTARFATPGVNIGLFCSTPMVALSRNLPRKQAMEMLLLGELVDANRALSLGLINRIVPADRLSPETLALATHIAGKSPGAIRHGKRAFHDQLEMPLDEAYAHTSRIMVANMLEADAAEGIGAFLDKRSPTWPTA